MVTFEVLPALPGKGPRAKPFSSTQKAWLQQGLVVKLTPNSGNSWVGNFQPGREGATGVFPHPGGAKVVVVATGQVYVVDPDARTAAVLPGAVANVHTVDDPRLLVFEERGVHFRALGAGGLRWRTKQITWSAFRNVAIEGTLLSGESCDAIGHTWERFEVDLRTGRTTGGTYHLADAAFDEVICEVDEVG